MNDLFSLDGRVAVITGSTMGMGLAMARALAQCGASIVISGREAQRTQRVVDELKDDGYAVAGAPCDITDLKSVAAFAQSALAAFGKVDALILNAAGSTLPGSLVQQSAAQFEEIMTGNVSGNIALTNALVPQMIARKDGSILFMSSRLAKRGSAQLGLYGISKAAIDMLTRSLAIELAPHGINVNSICPGVVRTEFSREALWGDAQKEARMASQIPMGRIGEADDVAGLAVLLAGKAGRFISGQNISVDGASTA